MTPHFRVLYLLVLHCFFIFISSPFSQNKHCIPYWLSLVALEVHSAYKLYNIYPLTSPPFFIGAIPFYLTPFYSSENFIYCAEILIIFFNSLINFFCFLICDFSFRSLTTILTFQKIFLFTNFHTCILYNSSM